MVSREILEKLIKYVPELVALTLIASGRWEWLVGWVLFSVVACSVSYLFIGAGTFCKSPSGEIPLLLRLIHAPWIWEYQVVVAVDRWWGREAVNEVSPGLWLGRRPLPSEVPSEVGLVVDLTAESPRVAGLADEVDYVCLPTLDGFAPEAEAYADLVEKVGKCSTPVLIHCAKGQGRSSTVMAGVLIERGLASDIDEAVSLMRRSRPRVRLHPGQRRLVRSYIQNETLNLVDPVVELVGGV